ncbi:methyltransferase domain-containing protein [Sphingomonas aliaeris]|uniref:Methyltransferase domain-containing protein n=1 Tax=Sphingomonas aliaeris TaxID=2759526 RepID=A0A974NX14_9SPHN|nr:class I SAM-dependent methyltransferase [Sphingomonas aliaeris]QQV78467.1 methyltransferase domain-containing protein [Sphingomonas aliaeris]
MTTDTLPACQGCGAPLSRTLVDLGMQPLANSYIPIDRGDAPEPIYPLHARVCDVCLLVQVDDVVPAEDIFDKDYAYFSSFSESWLAHCKRYAEDMAARFELDADSRVVEIASNDGYMLQYFVAMGVPVMGIEPAANVAATAVAKGVPTEVAFFGEATARRMVAEGWAADLLAAKNVLAHVPDINDFVAGVREIVKPEGVFTVEFPHLLNLIEQVQFDTIYHEHFTYLSLLAVKTIAERQGLRIFDVTKQPTHGGSLRVFMARPDSSHAITPNVQSVLDEEIAAGLDRPAGYEGFDERVRAVRSGLLEFLASAKEAGKRVVAYGAAAKGNTLLNYCGVTAADIDFAVDRNPAKQNTLLPGSHIPVRTVDTLIAAQPDHVLILPWNIKNEVMRQLLEVAGWGGDFVIAVPNIQVATGAV